MNGFHFELSFMMFNYRPNSSEIEVFQLGKTRKTSDIFFWLYSRKQSFPDPKTEQVPEVLTRGLIRDKWPIICSHAMFQICRRETHKLRFHIQRFHHRNKNKIPKNCSRVANRYDLMGISKSLSSKIYIFLVLFATFLALHLLRKKEAQRLS